MAPRKAARKSRERDRALFVIKRRWASASGEVKKHALGLLGVPAEGNLDNKLSKGLMEADRNQLKAARAYLVDHTKPVPTSNPGDGEDKDQQNTLVMQVAGLRRKLGDIENPPGYVSDALEEVGMIIEDISADPPRIGKEEGLNTALTTLRGVHARFVEERKQEVLQSNQSDEVSKTKGPGTDISTDGRACQFCGKDLAEDHQCSTEEKIRRTRPRVRELGEGKKPSHHASGASATPPAGGELESEMETIEAEPAVDSDSAPELKVEGEMIDDCPFPISGLYGGSCSETIVTFTAKSDRWEAAWLRYLFQGAEQRMCRNCAERIEQVFGDDPIEARQELAEVGVAFDRPFGTCVFKLKGCEHDALDTFWGGSYLEIWAVLNANNDGKDNAHVCPSCLGKLLRMVKSYNEGGKEELQEYLTEMDVPFAPPASELVEEVVEIATCADCGATAGLVSAADGEEQLCNICSLIRVAKRKGVSAGKRAHARKLQGEKKFAEAVAYLTKILFEVSGSQGVVAEEERAPCLNPFKPDEVACSGLIAAGDKNLCPACRGFANSAEWYEGPQQRLRRVETYYFRCSSEECNDAGSLTGQQLLDFGPPPLEDLLCHSCYEEKMVAERATWPACPNPFKGEGFEDCQGRCPPKGEAKGNGGREFHPLCAACHFYLRQKQAAQKRAAMVVIADDLAPAEIAA